MSPVSTGTWRIRAGAKINLTLGVLGLRPDGYHELRTTFQSLAMHDTLTFERVRGAFVIASDAATCPTDASNLVWKAADALWRATGKRGALSGVRVDIKKRIPIEAGLGGGSSDAAATLVALRAMWRARVSDADLADIGRTLGADVPFFLEGGTVLGLERGDLLFPLLDAPPAWVVIARPDFGVSTKDAYAWWDQTRDMPSPIARDDDAAMLRPGRRGSRAPRAAGQPAVPGRGAHGAARGLGVSSRSVSPFAARGPVNDLQAPVCARHPKISSIINELERSCARQAAMSGSGSAVFGLFESRRAALDASARLNDQNTACWVTRTTTRAQHLRSFTPQRIV